MTSLDGHRFPPKQTRPSNREQRKFRLNSQYIIPSKLQLNSAASSAT
ncbi:unnamed protein product, partial [Brugia timori]|uniref:Uncharacterized protein n=1 Tax=Brugia timori TaxID=42155 RepID=A0A0R3Q8L7_9BILA